MNDLETNDLETTNQPATSPGAVGSIPQQGSISQLNIGRYPGGQLQQDGTMNRAGQQNVGRSEQLMSILLGGGLVASGLFSRSKLRLVGLLSGAALIYRGVTGHCAIYEQLGVDTSHEDIHRGVRAQHGRKVKCSIHIHRNPQDLYDYWRNFENLPRVMSHLQSVTIVNEKISEWTAYAPMGQTLTWQAELITDEPGKTIAWQSLPGSQVDTAGSVHFRTPPSGEGTDVVVTLKYDPPGGAAAAQVAHLLGYGLEEEINEELRALKQMFETGETATAAQRPQ